MVAVVVVEVEVVLAVVAGVLLRLAVALLELELFDATVPQSEAPPEEVVRGVRAQYLRRGKLPDAADGDGDVRDSRLVDDAQFLTRRAVDVLCHIAIGELDAHGVVQQVVVYPRYPPPGVAHEGAGVVVGEGVHLTGHPVEVRCTRVGIAGGTVTHTGKHVARIRHGKVVNQPEGAVYVIDKPAAPQPGDVALAVILHVLAEVVPIAREVVARAIDRTVQAVAAVVFQVVSLIGAVVARPPFHGTDVPIPTSSVKAVGIVQALLELTVDDTREPSMHVVY